MATTVTISKPGDDLVITGAATTAPSISLVRRGLTLPARQARVAYLPDNPDIPGSIPASWAWQQAMLSMRVRIETATEDAHQDLLDVVYAALGQISYTATIVQGSHTSVWACGPGSCVPADGGRDWFDDGRPVVDLYQLTIPVHPIPTA